jgi:hypothetical protein
MICACATLDDCFFLESAPKGFEKNLKQLEMADWKRLYGCPVCDALWAIDEWDKFYDQVVSRVTDRARWSKDESEENRKDLLWKSRGGEEGGTCICAGCDKRRIKGVVYWIDHLYETGARK